MSEPTPLWDPADPVASEDRLRLAADGASAQEQLVLMTQVARALTLQQEYDRAHAVLDDLSPTSDEVAVRIVLERGRLLAAQGRPDEARPQLLAASPTAAAARLDDLRTDAQALLATL